MEADIEFVAPAQVEIDSYAANGLPVYVYSFNYLPESHIYEEVQLFSTIIFEKCILGEENLQSIRKRPSYCAENREKFSG